MCRTPLPQALRIEACGSNQGSTPNTGLGARPTEAFLCPLLPSIRNDRFTITTSHLRSNTGSDAGEVPPVDEDRIDEGRRSRDASTAVSSIEQQLARRRSPTPRWMLLTSFPRFLDRGRERATARRFHSKNSAASISVLERSAFAKVPRLYVASVFFFLFRQSAANVQQSQRAFIELLQSNQDQSVK